MEELSQKLVDWIRGQVSDAGCEGVVFGLSGGVDSAVVGALCKRTFPDKSLAVIMPCHSSKADVDDAVLVAREFAIPSETVILDGIFDSLLQAFPGGDYDPSTRQLAEANLKPRLRMSTLYYFANRLRYLVVGTGNRSEIAVGYCTKYGDAGTDILPLGNLLKSQVRELAKHLGVPGRIIDRPPSAGLWPGQTDEEELGFSYEELDRYLLTGEASGDLKRNLEARLAASVHNRRPPPVPDV